MKISNLLVALLATSILTIGLGMGGVSTYSYQYIDAQVGTPGYISIWPYTSYMSWQLYDGSNIYDSGDSAGPEDWFVSSNRDWHADVYDAYGRDGHLYSWNYGYSLSDQLDIYPYTYGTVPGVTLSNSYQNLWAGPAGDNLWLDTAYSYDVGSDEPEDYYNMEIGVYGYTDY